MMPRLQRGEEGSRRRRLRSLSLSSPSPPPLPPFWEKNQQLFLLQPQTPSQSDSSPVGTSPRSSFGGRRRAYQVQGGRWRRCCCSGAAAAAACRRCRRFIGRCCARAASTRATSPILLPASRDASAPWPRCFGLGRENRGLAFRARSSSEASTSPKRECTKKADLLERKCFFFP